MAFGYSQRSFQSVNRSDKEGVLTMIMDKNSGHNLARKTELRRTIRRIGRGSSKVKTDAGKRGGLLLV